MYFYYMICFEEIAYFSFFGIALALIGGVQLYKIETLLDKVNHQIMRNK